MSELIDLYIEGHIDREPAELYHIWRNANTQMLYPRMCSGHVQGRVLKMLTRMINPLRVLELGTYVGYSALCIAEGLSRPGARVDTIEIDDEIADVITANLASSPYGERVNLIVGDAAQLLSTMDIGAYDMIYMDANKRQYADYYEAIMPALRSGAYIIADNTLWDGKVANLETNHDAQTVGVARFNDLVATDSRVEKVILPVRDGLTIIRKI